MNARPARNIDEPRFVCSASRAYATYSRNTRTAGVFKAPTPAGVQKGARGDLFGGAALKLIGDLSQQEAAGTS